MIRSLFSLYSWRYPTVLVYMLQNTEYYAGPYLKWFWRTNDFTKVTYRRTLDRTKAARLLLFALRAGIAVQIIAGLVLLWLAYARDTEGAWQFGLALLLSYPIVWAHLIAVPLIAGRWLVIVPRQKRLIRRSRKLFQDHPGKRVAIVGSYGKTSMKELLLTVLSEGLKVAATPANMNVAISHARFAHKLEGNEDILLIEYGEARPGDIARFAKVTYPTHAIVTGVAPAHLDRYRTVERAAEDIFSISNFVEPQHLYINAESPFSGQLLAKNKHYQAYSQKSVLGWEVTDIKIDVDGTGFTLKKEDKKLQLRSGLVGRHQVGPLALVAALAKDLGLTDKQVKAGIAQTTPFEHRMQPYKLSGAWVIDDSYNGNIEGIKAGTTLLKELTAKRKIYITPGLVDQGVTSTAIHEQMGRLIADAQPDLVVLMKNSATPSIQKGLVAAGYKGELQIEADPLEYYSNLQSFIAAGDVVLMQNDWTDNYA